MAVLVTPGTSGAAETPMLGSWQGFPASSMCFAPSAFAGVRVALDHREYVAGVASLCEDADGTITAAPAIGSETGVRTGDAACPADRLADGLHGRAGAILDAVGVRCGGNDGPLVGGTGGEASGPLDCPSGTRLVGLAGTTVFFDGGRVVSTLTGVCERIEYASTATLGRPAARVRFSFCPADAELMGITAARESRGHIASVAGLCEDASGAVSAARAIFATWGWSIGMSTCDGTTPDGIHGRFGDVLDAVAVRCEGTDGPLLGGSGGVPSGALDCSEGERLAALAGSIRNYFGRDVVSSLAGLCLFTGPVCGRFRCPTDKDECKDDNWRRYAPAFRNQGTCVSFVETGGRHE